LKLVAWRKKCPGLHPGQPTKQIIVARIHSDHWRSKSSNGFEQILAHRIGCQRAKPPCLAERHIHSPSSMPSPLCIVNTVLTFSTAPHSRVLPSIYTRDSDTTRARTSCLL
jgi:hypothetical protein